MRELSHYENGLAQLPTGEVHCALVPLQTLHPGACSVATHSPPRATRDVAASVCLGAPPATSPRGVVRPRARSAGGAPTNGGRALSLVRAAGRRVHGQLLDVRLQLHKLVLLELGREGMLEAAWVAHPRLRGVGGERPAVGAAAQPLLQPMPRSLEVTRRRRRCSEPRAKPRTARSKRAGGEDMPKAHCATEARGRLCKAGAEGNSATRGRATHAGAAQALGAAPGGVADVRMPKLGSAHAAEPSRFIQRPQDAADPALRCYDRRQRRGRLPDRSKLLRWCLAQRAADKAGPVGKNPAATATPASS